ncbi:MAG: AarF/ABC1/UbiB kinase family protein [Alphaproteobacteria bacterium]|nr:AarF/ABC1/UbiB kinase family protein [Alphaproteobacteria bacterium]
MTANDKPGSGEKNSLSRRLKRYADVTTAMGGAAAKMAGKRMLGMERDPKAEAIELRGAFGNLKGPLMKVVQMLASVPEALPADFAVELSTLQTQAPPMGWPFVRRRMSAELGPDWEKKFKSFEHEAAAAASLGQVHRAFDKRGRALACKLQYPDMASAVEADLSQLKLMFALYRRMDRAIDPSEMAEEIGARLREELDYRREAAHMRLYRVMLKEHPTIRVPDVIDELSTGRLLTMSWETGSPILEFVKHPLADRNRIATSLFRAWWHPFSHFGAIHGDPHLGNYAIREDLGLNLLDYGCVRTFDPKFVGGVIDLYHAMEQGKPELAVHAYETWGFKGLKKEIIETLNIWARFIYAPMLENRVRSVANGVEPSAYGRKEAFEVHKRLSQLGPVKPPREFVFMDRAAIGLGAVFLHLQAELNFHKLFNEEIESFTLATVAKRQKAAFKDAGVPLPV